MTTMVPDDTVLARKRASMKEQFARILNVLKDIVLVNPGNKVEHIIKYETKNGGSENLIVFPITEDNLLEEFKNSLDELEEIFMEVHSK